MYCLNYKLCLISAVPELRSLAREDNVLRFLKSSNDDYIFLKDCFNAIMQQSQEKVSDNVYVLLCRLKYSGNIII